MPAPGVKSRASAVNSTNNPSANGRSVTSTRWNGHYLVPKKNLGADDSVPIDAFTGATPDWVFVTPTGAAVITSPNSSVIGRYSYAVYAEGGLLDMNVAGYPTGTTTTQSGRKGSVAFADLRYLGYPIPNPDTGGVYQIDRRVGWRNYATTQPSNNFPDTGPPANKAFAYNFQTDTTPAANFYNYVINNTNGFLSPSTATWNNRTDQVFVQRQQLIALEKTLRFSSNGQSSLNALQYVTHFSRDANAPSFSPSTPQGSTIDYAALANTATAINPNFLSRRVTNSFTRFDGTTAVVGEPLVKTRFPLSRLAWITYKGPSAVVYAANPGDPVILALTGAGVSIATIQAGTVANIQACFGLTFGVNPGDPWTYSHGAANRILRLDEVAGREPDFFELLQAGILSGSLGQNTGGGVTGQNNNADGSGLVFPDIHMSNTTHHILTIGACIIDQADPDSIPTRIQFSPDGVVTWTAYGVENLPYITQLYPIAGTSPNDSTKWASYLLFELWNPHQNASTLPNSVRLRVDGAIGIFTGGNVGSKWITGTTPQIIANGGNAGQSVALNSAFSFSAPFPLTATNTTNAVPAPGPPAGGAFAVLPAIP